MHVDSDEYTQVLNPPFLKGRISPELERVPSGYINVENFEFF